MKCEYCSAEETLPFNCAYCRKYFCVDHRLPENHQCSELWRAKKPVEYASVEPPPRKPFRHPYSYAQSRRSFSSWLRTEESKHLSAGTVLVLLVGLSMMSPNFRFLSFPIWAISLSAGLFAMSFLLHELSHKFTAQKNGLWAEFRMTAFGALLTIFSIFSTLKIIAPGAVTISGYANESVFGRVAVAGPITNILLGVLMVVASVIVPFFSNISVLKSIFVSTSVMNGFLAVFNLMPFGILDGRKVFVWNKRVWTIAFAISSILTILAYGFLWSENYVIYQIL